MKKRAKFLASIMALSLILFGLTGCGEAPTPGSEDKSAGNGSANEITPIYTAGSGSAAYFLAAGMASIISENIPSMQLAAEATTGTTEMVKLLSDRNKANKAAFVTIASDGAYTGYKGTGGFTQAYPELRAVSFLYGAEMLLVVPKDSPIQKWSDVKGKRIGIGAPGSTANAMSSIIIEKSGVKKEDYKPLPLGYTEVSQGISDGSIDGGVLAAASYNELAASKDIRIIPVDQALADAVVKDSPYYYKSVVKPGLLKGVTDEIPVLSFGILIATTEKTPEQAVYDFIKTVMDKHDELVNIHVAAKQMTPETVLTGIGIPLHPGAEKYFKEVGIMK